jgi:hypothetical protein
MKNTSLLLLLLFAVAGLDGIAGPNLLQNPNFRNNRMAGWWKWTAPAMKTGGFKQGVSGGKFIMEVPALENSRDYFVQLVQNITLEADRTYKLSFVLNSTGSGTAKLLYQNIKPPRQSLGLDQELTVTSGSKRYEITFAAKATDVKTGLWFCFGRLPGKTEVSDLILEVVPGGENTEQ